ncbi:hypothetical protein WG66_004513 [Moniliophthora roreri]|nr:hypothetical protein WG66_004513 [Moniliophthora roreri]
MSTTKSSDHVAMANLMLTGISSAATCKDWNKRIAGVGTAGNGSSPVLASEQAIAMLRMAGAGGKMEGDPKVWLGIVGSWLAVSLQFLFALLLHPWMLFRGVLDELDKLRLCLLPGREARGVEETCLLLLFMVLG